MTSSIPTSSFRDLASVMHYGVRGDGVTDDRANLQHAIDHGPERIHIPEGNYKIGGTLRIPSGKSLKFHERAVVTLADGAGTNQDVFLIANANPEEGNESIRIEGGVWDGNNRGNPRGGNTAGNYTGVSMNFLNVRNLELRDLQLRDAETYFIRTAWVRGFHIENLLFTTTNPRPNQDGIHVAGECHDGVIRNIHAIGPSATKDDLVALVADDALARAQNLGLCCGEITNIRVDNLSADDCHSFVRLASVRNAIKDVIVQGVRGGCEACAVNMDALRYCAMPIFSADDEEFARGAGDCRNIVLSDFKFFRSKNHLNNPLVLLETLVENFRIEKFERLLEKDAALRIPTLRIAEIQAGDVCLAGLDPGEAERLLSNGAKGFLSESTSIRGSLSPTTKIVSNTRKLDLIEINIPQ